MKNPFLDESFEIRWSQFDAGHVEADVTIALERAQERIDAIAAVDRDDLTFENTFLALEDADRELDRAWGIVMHLASVMNSDELRSVFNAMLPLVSTFYSRIPLNSELWSVLKDFAEGEAAGKLSPVRKRFIDETKAAFIESGADLPPDKKSRLEEVQKQLSEKTQKFSENVLDSTNAFELIIDDESQLAGLPEMFVEAAKAGALSKGHGTEDAPAFRFTLQMPSFIPAMKFIDSEEIRKTLFTAFVDRASSGEHDNTEGVWEILKLRREKASILGKKNFADVVLSRRMAKNGDNALSFIEDLHERTVAAFREENEGLERFRAEETGDDVAPLNRWDSLYW